MTNTVFTARASEGSLGQRRHTMLYSIASHNPTQDNTVMERFKTGSSGAFSSTSVTIGLGWWLMLHQLLCQSICQSTIKLLVSTGLVFRRHREQPGMSEVPPATPTTLSKGQKKQLQKKRTAANRERTTGAEAADDRQG
jgi:hypothetical protein